MHQGNKRTGKQHLGLPKRPAKISNLVAPIAHPMENRFLKLRERHVAKRAPQNRFREMSPQQHNLSATTESCFSFLWSSQYGRPCEYQKCQGADRYSPLCWGCYAGSQSLAKSMRVEVPAHTKNQTIEHSCSQFLR